MRYVRQAATSTAIVQQPATGVVKASVFGREVATQMAYTNVEDEQMLYGIADVIRPPYDPESLCRLYERSAALRPNVDAYAVNIEAFGYRLTPKIDPGLADAMQRVRDAMVLERLFDGAPPFVPDEEAKARLLEVTSSTRIERLTTEAFFENCVDGMSFVELRKRTRVDLEVTGNAYWEVVRNRAGKISKFAFVPAISMRLIRIDPFHTQVEAYERVSSISVRQVRAQRRFRRFVQYIRGLPLYYFKELDDPRVVSAGTGHYYATIEELLEREGAQAMPANEVLHFKIHSPMSVYGVPRWVGASVSIAGSRAAEEVNATYFDNKAVPPLAILVSGGKLAEGAADRITRFIGDHLQGRENFHQIMVLEAESSAAGGAMTGNSAARVRVDIKPLMDAQQKDALFQEYDKNNAEKVGNQFRLPKLIRGNSADVNRATADAALRYAEQQVFQPERAEVDYIIDKRILMSRGVRFHEFVSNSPDLRDPSEIAANIEKLVDVGVLTAGEGRELAAEVFNREFEHIKDAWVRMPPKLLIAGIKPEPTAEDLAAAAAAAAGGAPDDAIPNIALAPTDAAQVVTVNEARRSLKLGPMVDSQNKPLATGSLTLAEFRALTGAPGTGAPPVSQPGTEVARALSAVRKSLDAVRELAEDTARKQLYSARMIEGETTVLVPAEEFAKWVAADKAAAAS